MMNERWVAAAFTTDELVADLLLRLKQSPETASLNHHPVGWGDRKSRSKGQQQRSPSTPLSCDGDVGGGGGSSASDGCDLFSGDGSVKVGGSTTFLDNKSRKRKVDIAQMSCKARSEMEIQKRAFVLPDLNEIPAYEEFVGL